MEVKIQQKSISVYGICSSSGDVVYVGRWERGSALEFRDRVYKEVDYGWLSDCVTINNALYVFGYSGGVVDLDYMYVIKRVPYIAAEYVATDGKFVYIATPDGLHVFNRDLKRADFVKADGLRDVAVGEDGAVYVLGKRTLCVYNDGRLKPVYKLDGDAYIGYYVLPHGDSVYVSTLNRVVRLDAKTYSVKAFSPRLARTIAVVDNYLVSIYDNVIAVADRTSLSVIERQYVHGLSAGFAKARVFKEAVLAPVYFKEESAVLALTP